MAQSDRRCKLGWQYRAKSIAFNVDSPFTQRRYEMELGTSRRCGRGAPLAWRLPGFGVCHGSRPNQDVRSDRSGSVCLSALLRLPGVLRSELPRWLGVFFCRSMSPMPFGLIFPCPSPIFIPARTQAGPCPPLLGCVAPRGLELARGRFVSRFAGRPER